MKIDKSWNKILHLDIFHKIIDSIEDKIIIPSKSKLLVPFSYFKLNQLKIVILGEEPYPNPNYSNGLAFSVNKNIIKLPQSIKNIFREINNEYNNKYTFIHGDLTKWASREKILLLNTSLTVSKEETSLTVSKEKTSVTISNKKYWKIYTDLIIKEISENTKHVCFVLMGNYARSKKYLIDENKHCILECIHPSPNSASRGFFESNIFKNIDNYVGNINWQN
jgi:uracil-DNA glycosylase